MVEELTPGGEGIKIWWGESAGEIFPGRGNKRIFGWGGTPPIIIASRENLVFTNTCYNKHPLKYFQENTHVMSKILKSF